jgi:LysM repeat protein
MTDVPQTLGTAQTLRSAPMRSIRSLPPLVVVTALVLAGCGDDEDPAGGPSLPPMLTSSTTSTSVATATTLPQYYEVQRGDTLTLIAAAYGIPVQALMRANRLTDPDDIQAGQFLTIPRREDIVAVELPPTAPGQTAPPMPTVAGATTAAPRTAAPTTTAAP